MPTPNHHQCEVSARNLIIQEDSSTARYDSVCAGCPPWIECDNCTVVGNNLAPTCSKALEHTSANERGNTLESLSIDSGYWRATVKSSTILACYNKDACLGGQTGADTVCDDGYMGPCEYAQRPTPHCLEYLTSTLSSGTLQ